MDLEMLEAVQPPTRAERIKLLQQEAEAEANHLFDDFATKLYSLSVAADELVALGSSFAALSAAARELQPQIRQWASVVEGTRQKRR